MRLATTCLYGAFAVFAAACTANAGTLIPVAPVSGATITNVYDVNDKLQIAGSYTDSGGKEHGFYDLSGTWSGSYGFYDYPGTAIGTELRSINNARFLLGFAPDESFASGPEFLIFPTSSPDTFMKDGVPLKGIAQGLKAQQVSTGDYLNGDSRMGYRGKRGFYRADVVPDVIATRVSARDINKSGAIAGFFVDAGGDHGYIIDSAGTTHVYDIDASGTTTFEGLNDNGIATGQVVDEDLDNHAFIFDPATSTVTWIDVPGSTEQQAWGINRKGYVAVSTDIGSFIYCPLKPRHCPAGGFEIRERTTQAREGLRALAPSHPREARRGAAR